MQKRVKTARKSSLTRDRLFRSIETLESRVLLSAAPSAPMFVDAMFGPHDAPAESFPSNRDARDGTTDRGADGLNIGVDADSANRGNDGGDAGQGFAMADAGDQADSGREAVAYQFPVAYQFDEPLQYVGGSAPVIVGQINSGVQPSSRDPLDSGYQPSAGGQFATTSQSGSYNQATSNTEANVSSIDSDVASDINQLAGTIVVTKPITVIPAENTTDIGLIHITITAPNLPVLFIEVGSFKPAPMILPSGVATVNASSAGNHNGVAAVSPASAR